MENEFYDGTKLLSLKDENGVEPTIYICTGNRTAGKTVYFSRLVVNKFLKKKEKFILLYRFSYQLDNVENNFFQDVQQLFFKNYYMRSKSIERGIIKELYMGNIHSEEKENSDQICGYAIAMNAADAIKRYRALFTDCTSIILDEFQSESNKYCPKEITKFQSIYTTCAGRRNNLKVYMISNTVSLLNPYYIQMGIAHRLKNNTKFLKGDGYVLEQTFNESAANTLKSGGFFRAFAGSEYSAYSNANVYLNDNLTFVEKMSGDNSYVCTIDYKGNSYGIRLYGDILYVSKSADLTFKERIALTLTDHGPESCYIDEYKWLLVYCKKFFSLGNVRFEDLLCKEAFFIFVGLSICT